MSTETERFEEVRAILLDFARNGLGLEPHNDLAHEWLDKTVERILQAAKASEAEASEYERGFDVAMAHVHAQQAEAEPVGWYKRFDNPPHDAFVELGAFRSEDAMAEGWKHCYTTPPAPAPVVPMEKLKEICTSFFYWWHNQPGSNTQDGFDEWMESEDVQRLVAGVTAPAPVVPEGVIDTLKATQGAVRMGMYVDVSRYIQSVIDALQSSPQQSAPVVPDGLIMDVMQELWNTWVADTNTIPSDFQIHGPRTTQVSFRASVWATDVAREVNRRLSAVPHPAEQEEE